MEREKLSLRRRIQVRYASALILIACLVTLSELFIGIKLFQHQSDVDLINVSSEQKMLAVDIALRVQELKVDNAQPRLIVDLKSALSKFKLNHQTLSSSVAGAIPVDSYQEQLRAIYFGPQFKLDERVKNFHHQVQSLIDGTPVEQSALLFSSVELVSLIEDLDMVVNHYEAASEAELTAILYMETYVWLGVLLTLGFIAVFVFKPLENRLITYTERLKKERNVAVEAKQKADEAMKAKSDFLSNMSHELRTPLNGVLGMVDLATTEGDNGKRRHFLGEAKESIRRLSHVVDNILDITQIGEGKTIRVERDFNLPELLESCISTFSQPCDRKEVTLHFIAKTDLPNWVRTDDLRLKQVIKNIIDNAVKFTLKGSIKVTVGVKVQKGLVLELTVQDTGIGIPHDKYETIFERFVQLNASQGDQFGGVGIGLSMCKESLGLLGGNIHLESQLGVGSTFTIRVPLGQPNNKVRFPAKSDTSQAKSLRCALLDTNQDAKHQLTLVLKQLGISIDYFNSIESLKQSGPLNAYFATFIGSDFHKKHALNVEKEIRCFSNGELARFIYIGESHSLFETEAAGSDLYWKHYSKPLNPYSIRRDLKLEIARNSSPDLRKTLQVLVVEDNDINAMIVKHMLEEHGHQVEHVENGKLAVERVQQKSFDIVIMDVDMPVMNGLEASKKIKRELKLSVPIVALTANAYDADVKASLEAGMFAHLAKPIDKYVLVDAIQKAIIA